jgi:DNA-binding response OmpR family regulator
LSASGFVVDIATSGAKGLSAASCTPDAAVIVDLRLPDTNGIWVIEPLRSLGNHGPVMLLSGVLDLEVVGSAARAGVQDIRRKPLYGEDLTASIQNLVNAHRDNCGDMNATSINNRVTPLLRVRTLAVALTRTEMTAAEYVLLVAAFRRLTRSDTRLRLTLANASIDAIKRADDILLAIGQHLGNRRLPRLREIAATVGASQASLTEVLHVALHTDFRECRRAMRVRPSLPAVAYSTEHYAQIGYSIGYEHPNQFARDFRLTFDLAPHVYRTLVSESRPVVASNTSEG